MQMVGEMASWPRERPWGLFTDIDGTIADIVARPELAMVRPGCHEALEELAERLPVVAVVTGRDVETARRMVGIDGLLYFGNHGLERWEWGRLSVSPEAREYLGRLQATLQALKERLGPPDLVVEDKGVGISIHYRTALEPGRARSTALDVLGEIGANRWLKVTDGKMIIDLRLPLDVNKGTAVRTTVEEFRLQGAILLGDDLTDVDAFRAGRRLHEERGFVSINVAVAGEETPEEVRQEADYTLPGVAAAEEFLLWLSWEVRIRVPS